MSSTNEDQDGHKPIDGEGTDEDILCEARERYRLCQDADSENRADALDDLLFLSGGENQWDPLAVAQRTSARRPMITVNTLPTYLHQVTNDQRQNTPSIKVHPVGDSADVETAKVRQGMIRHIEYDSNADVCYDTAVNSAAGIGFGYFRIMPEWDAEASWQQKLCFLRIRNALSVKIDPLAVNPDGSDMQFCFLDNLMSRAEFKRKYPDANASNPTIYAGDTGYAGWWTENTVLVCEYYRITKTKETVVLLSNGESGFKSDLLELPEGITITKNREGFKSRVMWYKITGCDILERTEIKCKWIPVFPVYGDELDIEGKVVRSGIVRHAKGPAQMYNVMMTSAMEEAALRSKVPYMMAEGQDEDHEDEFAMINNVPLPYVTYKPKTLDGILLPPPRREPMADVPQGFLSLAMHSSDNVKKTTGLFDSSLGAKGTATSGIQEREQQQQGDMANSHYMDGLLRTVRHAGRCLDCMIPNYYDYEGIALVMREDGTVTHAQINTPQTKIDQETGQAITTVLHDMTCGEYAVTVSAGPGYSTMRQESAEFFTSAMRAAKDPGTAAVVTYLAMQNNDAPGADIATRMLASMLPPPAKAILDEENAEGDEAPPPMVDTPHGPIPAQQAAQLLMEQAQKIQQCEQALEKANQTKLSLDAMKQQQILNEQQLEPGRQQAERLRLEADIEKAKAASVSAQADLTRAQAEAATAPMKAQADAVKANTDAMTAETNLITSQQNAEMEAALAEARALQGDDSALEILLETMRSRTKIRVAEIMTDGAARRAEISASAKPKKPSNGAAGATA